MNLIIKFEKLLGGKKLDTKILWFWTTLIVKGKTPGERGKREKQTPPNRGDRGIWR
ncbi:MAG: hypothetical protein CM15mV28_0900 [Thaumasvirus sp.]|nr:MAG: hypothetical protein CM15mV28_0900 [Thaumasvirus sp.]